MECPVIHEHVSLQGGDEYDEAASEADKDAEVGGRRCRINVFMSWGSIMVVYLVTVRDINRVCELQIQQSAAQFRVVNWPIVHCYRHKNDKQFEDLVNCRA